MILGMEEHSFVESVVVVATTTEIAVILKMIEH